MSGCAQVVSDLKASRQQNAATIHEHLSRSIHQFGFSHGIRSIRNDDQEIDTVFVAVPLDALKRQYIMLHHMLFNIARICARPEFANVDIRIELNAGDEADQAYMRSIVEPVVAPARNVTVVSQRDGTNDVVITTSHGGGKQK
jgi:hypothetical protein